MRACRVTSSAESENAYPCTIEDPKIFWANGLPLSRAWFADNLGKHVEAFHLKDDQGRVVGHIYWAPSNRALAPYDIEDVVAYVYCEWIQKSYRGKGGMRMLFEEFVDYLHRRGFKGILVDTTNIEEYMHQRHFLRRGFHVVREYETGKLLYYPINQENIRVEPLEPQVTREGTAPVDLLVIGSHFCPVAASAVLTLRKVAAELADTVALREVATDRSTIEQYGVADGVYINGKTAFYGPVNEETVRETIRREQYLSLSGRRSEQTTPTLPST
jgi:GNAT superfamily N-acetyltransferase